VNQRIHSGQKVSEVNFAATPVHGDAGTPRTLSSKDELMAGRSERERERETFQRELRKKARYIRIGGEPRGIA
jgi:hypothetical protein